MLAKASAEGFRRHYSDLYSGQYIELSMTQKNRRIRHAAVAVCSQVRHPVKQR